MAGTVRHFYAAGNTARGFYSLFDDALKALERLFILKGGPGSGKSTMIRKIANEMNRRGYDIEMIHCASDNGSLDGVIVTELKLGIVDGTAPHVIEPKAPGAVEEYVNLGIAWDSSYLRQKKEKIMALNEKISRAYRGVYDTLEAARTIYDQWKAIYANRLDTSKLDDTAKHLVNRIFPHDRRLKSSKQRHLFAGAFTPKGPVDFIPNLTKDARKRFFLKGHPGTGKSYILKKIVAAAGERGFDIEIFHSGFDPQALQMVLLPQLNTAIFDSTPPAEYFPERHGDEIVDLNAVAVTPGTDERIAAAVKNIKGQYQRKIKEATAQLRQTKTLRDELEALYAEAIDFRAIDQIREQIQGDIDAFASSATNE